MKTLGLIGGTSWHSTIEYYRYINQMVDEQFDPPQNPPLLIYSLNVDLMRRGDWNEINQAYLDISLNLQKAGVEAIVICANTPHKVISFVAPKLGISYLLIGVAVTNATTPEPVNPWEWQAWNYDVFWHRITTVFFVWWMGSFCYVIVVESARLSSMSDNIASLDLFDMRPYQPLIRQGLTNALLVIGMVSVLSLLAVESRYVPVLVGFWIAFIVLAWIGMMLPLRAIRKRIKVAKNQELDWCRQRMVISRDALKSGDDEKQSIAEIVAYRTMIENIRNWPFDSSTLIRFTLYLLIPLGSWLGGAFVERGLDFILS